MALLILRFEIWAGLDVAIVDSIRKAHALIRYVGELVLFVGYGLVNLGYFSQELLLLSLEAEHLVFVAAVHLVLLLNQCNVLLGFSLGPLESAAGWQGMAVCAAGAVEGNRNIPGVIDCLLLQQARVVGRCQP